MAKIKNIATGEIINVNHTEIHDGKLVMRGLRPEPGTRFLNGYPMLSKGGETVWNESFKIGCRVLDLADGWEIMTGRAPRKPRQSKQGAKDEVMPQPEVQPEVPEVEPIPESETTPEEVAPVKVERQIVTPVVTPAPQPTFNTSGIEGGLAQVFAPVFNQVAAQIEANIRASVDAEMRELKEIAEKKAHRIEVVVDGKANKVSGKTHKEFNRVLQRVARGRHIYLWGPAGTGKSYLAKQIADALGLPFYSETTLQDPFDLKGFKDASGKYNETQFYKAVKNGGVFNLDEADASAADIFVVVNTLLANGYFSFPNGERLDCHPDFHFMCTANTCGLGATQEYNGRFKMDESTRDRFSFIYIAPDKEIELEKAGGDTEIIEFAYAVRDAVKRATGLEFNCSSRVIAALAQSKDFGETPEETLDSEFVKGRNIDNVKSLINNMQLPSSNKWMKALINISNDEQWRR